jgi:hypothetical protein
MKLANHKLPHVRVDVTKHPARTLNLSSEAGPNETQIVANSPVVGCESFCTTVITNWRWLRSWWEKRWGAGLVKVESQLPVTSTAELARPLHYWYSVCARLRDREANYSSGARSVLSPEALVALTLAVVFAWPGWISITEQLAQVAELWLLWWEYLVRISAGTSAILVHFVGFLGLRR